MSKTEGIIRSRLYRTTQDYLPIAELKIDVSYHRAYNEQKAVKLLKESGGRYLEEVAGLLLVSKRNDGTYYIIAGLHRAKIAEMAGEELVPCTILHGVSIPEEAELARVEAGRNKESSIDQFRQEYVAGRGEVTAIVRICRKNGIDVEMRMGRAGSGMHAFDGVQTLRTVYRMDEGKTLDRILRVQRAAWGKPCGDVKLLRGMADLYKQQKAVDDDILAASLKRDGYITLCAFASDLKPRESPMRVGFMRAVAERYSTGRRTNRLSMPWR